MLISCKGCGESVLDRTISYSKCDCGVSDEQAICAIMKVLAEEDKCKSNNVKLTKCKKWLKFSLICFLVILLLIGIVASLKYERAKRITESMIEMSNLPTVIWGRESTFELYLNNQVSLDVFKGDIVTFTVREVAESSIYGYNLHAGENLNFIFPSNINAKVDDVYTVKIASVEKFLGSYIIYCNLYDTIFQKDLDME